MGEEAGASRFFRFGVSLKTQSLFDLQPDAFVDDYSPIARAWMRAFTVD